MDNGVLQRCEQEALHLSGAIQPHGTLLVVGHDRRITHVAVNVAAFLDPRSVAGPGRRAPPDLERLIALLPPEPGSRHVHERALDGPGGALDVVVTRGAGGAVVAELTRHVVHGDAHRPVAPPLPVPLPDATAVQAQREALVQRIAALTGFQRVMYYRFREDGDGEVLAETRAGRAYGSYLGLRFPASDIPAIARNLYRLNPWRLIADASAAPVPIEGAGVAPPDLSHSDLRSVSPMHAVYLANMEVAASLSFPVVCAGTLVALVAAHHREPQPLAVALLEQAAAEVRAHALSLASFITQRRMQLIEGSRRRFGVVRAEIRRQGSVSAAWPVIAPVLMQEFGADGATLCEDDVAHGAGLELEPAALAALHEWFGRRTAEAVWLCDSVSRHVPSFSPSQVAGVVAIRLQPGGLRRAPARTCIYLTRSEHVYDVAWGGNPEKPVEVHDGLYGLSPRRSFGKWIEKRMGFSRGWDNESRVLALQLRDAVGPEVSR